LALDLKDDPVSIETYELLHRNVWKRVVKSIRESGITEMEIYRVGNRLFMIIEVESFFSFENKRIKDEKDVIVSLWEKIMWEYQKPLPFAAKGEKWMNMKKIFSLSD
jgi:L-rhamnose mutarotase